MCLKVFLLTQLQCLICLKRNLEVKDVEVFDPVWTIQEKEVLEKLQFTGTAIFSNILDEPSGFFGERDLN